MRTVQRGHSGIPPPCTTTRMAFSSSGVKRALAPAGFADGVAELADGSSGGAPLALESLAATGLPLRHQPNDHLAELRP